ncbi:MAG TPA: AraC family transcriptional regulator ligand-binding domain-containing protein [Kofleriaceae bacterium]|jgi:AraC-like DNA-binding protein
MMLDEVAPTWRDSLPVELVEPDVLRSAEPYIAHEDMIALWTHYTDRHDDPLFGVHYAERHASGAVGMYAYAAAHAPDFGTAAQTCIKLQRMIDTHGGMEMTTEGDRAVIQHIPPTARWPRHLAESLSAGCIHLGRHFTDVHIAPLEAQFQHSDAGSAVSRWFDCPVKYDQPRNALVFDAATLALPFRHADPTQFAAIVAAASRTLEQVAPPADFLDEVRAAIRSRKGERTSLAQIARQIRMSERTLQRRLAEAGSTFRELLDEVRVKLMSEEEQTPQKRHATAAALGFADPSSLRRLRRRWRRSR